MYERFYGLDERPFELNADSRFLYLTPRHVEALSNIGYALSGRTGIALLLGDAGTGKTMLARKALREMPSSSPPVVYLSNPRLTRTEFIEFLALSLGLPVAVARSKPRLVLALERMLAERPAGTRPIALVIDEAQCLSDEMLDEVRLLGNVETAGERLFTILLIGRVELDDRLDEPPLRNLNQRIALRSSLGALHSQEITAYIAARLRVAGGQVEDLFTVDALRAIGEASAGIPRTISVVCENALIAGFALNQRPIGRGIVREVCRDFDLAGTRGPAGERVEPTALVPRPVVVRPAAEPESPVFTMFQPPRRRFFSWS
jgi:general secretion pathway protein A